ncbi:hypothetical protein [uncultured Campylobacter sp.]|uniref:hypothetical protein n=1 Tax=uncultured Campylobacter sp. TaxID=218934 RepID=UPI003211A65D
MNGTKSAKGRRRISFDDLITQYCITKNNLKVFEEQSELLAKYAFDFLDTYYWEYGNHLSNTAHEILCEHENELTQISFSDAIDILVARDDIFTTKLVKDWYDKKTQILIIKPKRGAKYAPKKIA